MGFFKKYLAYLEVVKDEELDEGNDTDKIDQTITLLNSEFSYCLLHFFKYEKAEACINEAKKLAQLNVEFAGKFGRRTRF